MQRFFTVIQNNIVPANTVYPLPAAVESGNNGHWIILILHRVNKKRYNNKKPYWVPILSDGDGKGGYKGGYFVRFPSKEEADISGAWLENKYSARRIQLDEEVKESVDATFAATLNKVFYSS